MDNRTRALSQAVSVDGWITNFDENGIATVHADIVFRTGGFGESPDDKVRFKIALKRAEVILRVPNLEPVKVVKKSVARTVAAKVGKVTSKSTKRRGLKAGFSALVGKDTSANVSASGDFDNSSERTTETEAELTQFLEQHITTEDDHYGWELQVNPDVEDKYLKGSPWDAVDAPRLELKHQTGEATKTANVVVEVRCSREDIEILDLEEKDPEKQALFRKKGNKNVNLAAAEQLIKEELFKAGFLEVPDLNEKHSRLLIADKIILVDED